WGIMVGALLATFFVVDSVQFTREPLAAIRRDRELVEPMRLHGALNAVWLGALVIAVVLLRAPWREVVIVTLTAVSLRTTSKRIRRDNRFSPDPMIEVAVVFAGIFVTMIPALDLLRLRGGELGLTAPWHFFWATGLLSSFLDNAPTYLAFL